jgi:hypothetical protein
VPARRKHTTRERGCFTATSTKQSLNSAVVATSCPSFFFSPP